MTLEPDRLWDEWAAALAEDPTRTPDEFAATLGDDAEEALELLLMMVGIVRSAPLVPLIDLLAAGSERAPDAADDGKGRLRFASFRIEEGLGQGSSGMVFAAVDMRVDAAGERDGAPPGAAPPPHRVALKILNPLLAAAPERRAQILREAEIAGRLDHPGIVRVLDRGIERGYAWIATELVDGRGLDEVITDGAPAQARVARALDLALQLARALAHAHAAGVVHRDLKPANVRVDAQGRARILDFGLARAEGTAFAVSSTGEAVGTPLYMAPEQARGTGEFGPWTDLYALGLMLLELGAGRRLIAEPNVLRSLDRIARGRLRPPKAMLADVPRPLRDVIERCLERHRDDRYPDAEALVEDLEAVRANEPLPWGALPWTVRLARRVRRHPLRAAAGFGAAAAIVWLGWAWRNQPVEVWIDSYGGGKLVSLVDEDGERALAQTPALVRLAPGDHELELHFNDPGPDSRPPHPRFRPRIHVAPHGAPKYCFVFEPKPEVPRLEAYPAPGADVDFAWVEVATPEPGLRIRIDDGAWQDTEGVCAFALPFGEHEVRIEADGKEPIVERVLIDDPELVVLSHVPSAPGASELRIPIQGPLDARVRRGTVELEGLRTYYETDNSDPEDTTRPVHKAYLGPTASYQPGHVLFHVELPFAPSKLDLELHDLDCCVDGYLLLEMGRAPDELMPILAWRPRNLPDSIRAELGDQLDTLDNEVHPERMQRLAELLANRTTLWIRYRIGGTAVGESVAYACALRTNEMPVPLTQGGKWRPAMEITAQR